MECYSLRQVANGWLVASDGVWSVGREQPALSETYAATIGEAFEIIRKHVKDASDRKGVV